MGLRASKLFGFSVINLCLNIIINDEDKWKKIYVYTQELEITDLKTNKLFNPVKKNKKEGIE